MERREPTLSPGAVSDSAQPGARRPQSHTDIDDAPARVARKPAAPVTASAPQAANSVLPVIALVIALVAALGAGFLGWQLFQAQTMLAQADVRIQGLEQQLSLTSEESTASVVTLQSNLKKMDADLRALTQQVETNRKAVAASNERTAAVGRDAASAQKTAADAKSLAEGLKQELAATKTAADSASNKVDSVVASVSKQSGELQSLRERQDKMSLEMTALDTMAARLRTNEDAISAIDTFRRSTNRELLQIKQQLGAKP